MLRDEVRLDLLVVFGTADELDSLSALLARDLGDLNVRFSVSLDANVVGDIVRLVHRQDGQPSSAGGDVRDGGESDSEVWISPGGKDAGFKVETDERL